MTITITDQHGSSSVTDLRDDLPCVDMAELF
jgi:hypothetical protein